MHTGFLYHVNAWSSRLTLGLVSVDQVWMGYNVIKGSVGSRFANADKLLVAIQKLEAGDIDGGLFDIVIAGAELSAEDVVGNLTPSAPTRSTYLTRCSSRHPLEV